MAKKHWINIKRGLSEDPKHREAMGMAVWAFIHILDRADWETGIVYDWRDKDEASDMGINERTLRDWRQRLDEKGYISCRQKQRGLEILIYNWINPRDYSSGVLNPKPSFQGDTESAPLDFQGDTQDDTQVRRKNVTPTSDSKNSENSNINDNDHALATLSKLYSDNIGAITPLGADLLRNISIEYPEAWYKPAFEIAVQNNARNLKYIETILRGWKDHEFGWKPAKSKPVNYKKSSGPTPLEKALARMGAD